jgi:hypothetical protein
MNLKSGLHGEIGGHTVYGLYLIFFKYLCARNEFSPKKNIKMCRKS